MSARHAHRWQLVPVGDELLTHCSCGELLGSWVDLEDGFELDAHGSPFAKHLEAVGEPATVGHQLVANHEGDGWNEPMHESLSCTCRLEIGSWTQKDPNNIDYPSWTTFLAGPAGVVFAHHLDDARDAASARLADRAQSLGLLQVPAIQRADQLGLARADFASSSAQINFPAQG